MSHFECQTQRTNFKSSARIFNISFRTLLHSSHFGHTKEPLRYCSGTYISLTVRDKPSDVQVVGGDEIESLEEDAVIGVDELNIATDNRNDNLEVVKRGVFQSSVRIIVH